ncbi:bcl-2-related ovarian killer protein-like [Lutzomyia longipalpis]|uniref:Putative apoptosis regulator protein of the bcl-2 family n=1 Tax=Lutzomyia longipalpis TaxID=7200 RepID=A0A1B0CFE9_LUTLO|nr:bcl-2-related ovarian killer protein-like [Lutzomyia longipalpis]XP_055691614.1 bcl-2-related ovarian killer protein-like [Lutzomyia longipalpis]XP_055691615.1 bcl-2-related ovarian killer protein-like [Lutzomyia longipalpis]
MSGKAPLESSLTTNNVSTPPPQKRKFSFPVTMHSSNLLAVDPAAGAASSARRRLSNVSDVVTRKLSNTIGWKAPAIPAHDIISQGRCLCYQYVRSRLKRAGMFTRKLGLQRVRSILGTSSIDVIREVFPALSYVGEELERMHPRVYTGVARQISRNPGGDLPSEETVPCLMSAVARDLFRADITWGKVISLFAIAGGLAVDCVRQGHSDYLPRLVEGVTEVIEDELVPWINDNGGWMGLSYHVNPSGTTEVGILEWIAIGLGCILGICVFIFIIKFLLHFLYPESQ